MDKEILEKIKENTSSRPTYQIVLTGVGSRLEAHFTPPIEFKCRHELALASLETYRSFPSIDSSNNEILVLINGTWEKSLFQQEAMILLI